MMLTSRTYHLVRIAMSAKRAKANSELKERESPHLIPRTFSLTET